MICKQRNNKREKDHANAITLKSLNLVEFASSVPLDTILILNPVKLSKSSTLNWYSLNSSFALEVTRASGKPLFKLTSIIESPNPSSSVSVKLLKPGNSSNVWST